MSRYRYSLVREPITKVEKLEREKLREFCKRYKGEKFSLECGTINTANRYTEFAQQETLYCLGNFRGSQIPIGTLEYIASLWEDARVHWKMCPDWAEEDEVAD